MTVTVAGVLAPLIYVSPNEIDALVPAQTAIPQNTVVPLVVSLSGGSVTYNIRLTRNAPALYTNSDTGQALLFDANFRPIDTIGPQDTVILYAMGLGPTDNSGRVVDDVEYISESEERKCFRRTCPWDTGPKTEFPVAMTIQVPPGRYSVRAVAQDAIEGKLAAGSSNIEIK